MSAETHIPLYSVRQYEGGADFHMVREWGRGHGGLEFTETLLPPDGFIAQEDGNDVGAAWCYFAAGIGVGHVEWMVTAPGLSVKQAKAVGKTLMDFLWLHAQNNNCGALFLHTLPAIARYADHLGLHVVAKGLVTLIKTN